MDGIFVAYHNTEKFFGFQYIPLTELDARLFGSSASGDRVFGKCLGILEALSEEIVHCFPGEVRSHSQTGARLIRSQSITVVAETREKSYNMNIYLWPSSGGRTLTVPADNRPEIKHLVVRVKHLRDGVPISSDEAITDVKRPCKCFFSVLGRGS